jgi:hypothetical protein
MADYIFGKQAAKLDVKIAAPYKANYYIDAEHTQDITENWTVITAPLKDGNVRGYQLNGSPDYNITFTGVHTCDISFNGHAMVSVNSAGQNIEFALFYDGAIVDKFTSNEDFITANTLYPLSTLGNIILEPSKIIGIKARRIIGTGNLEIKIKNLKITFNLLEVM